MRSKFGRIGFFSVMLILWACTAQGSSLLAGTLLSSEDKGTTNWQVTGVSHTLHLREEPSIKAKIITSYSAGTILANLGCRQGKNRIWCDVQQLEGGPRGYVAAEFLKPALSPDGSTVGPDDSALRAGRDDFDATGSIPCAQFAGQPMRQCEFGVSRAGGGSSTVDGSSRAIFFRMGKPVSADTSQADGYHELRSTREKDLQLIRIGDERYEIPDAVVFGG
ncbi:MAG: SH3 domain-containing protein [Deltaproteobacteria bacterium]|nr:SH3 domain-containing protein [Deltaproteobacteria bacterium]